MKITAIVGRNGSGKTQYVEQLRKKLASDRVRYIAFSDSYGPNVDNQYYLQLRWNQHDIDHETPTVGDLLHSAAIGEVFLRHGLPSGNSLLHTVSKP